METDQDKVTQPTNRVSELHGRNAGLRNATRAQLEAIAQRVENVEGFEIVYKDDPERPSQASHVDIDATLANIAAMVRQTIEV